MLYGICLTSKNKIINNFDNSFFKSTFFKYINEITSGHHILCSNNFYDFLPKKSTNKYWLFSINNDINNQTLSSICIDNPKTVITSYSGDSINDIYIYVTSYQLMTAFINDLDVLIIYNNNRMKSSNYSINDFVNFANYDLIERKKINKNSSYQCFVRNKNKYIGN